MQNFNKTLLAQLLLWKRDELQDTFDLGRVVCLTRPILCVYSTGANENINVTRLNNSQEYAKKIRTSLRDIWISAILTNEIESGNPIDRHQMNIWFLRLFGDDGVDMERDFWNQVDNLVEHSVLAVIPLHGSEVEENELIEKSKGDVKMCQVVEVNMTMAAYMVLELGLGLCLESLSMVGALNKK
jgi:hypothetical protein